MRHQVFEVVRSVVEVCIAVHGPLAPSDVDLSGGHPVFCDPFVGVMDREIRLGRDDDDPVAFRQPVEGRESIRIRFEVSEQAGPVEMFRSPPEFAHVGEMGQRRNDIPSIDII